MISNGKEYRIFDIHWGNSDSNLETNYKMDQFADFTTTTLGIICGRTFSKTFIVLSKLIVQNDKCRYNSFIFICNC